MKNYLKISSAARPAAPLCPAHTICLAIGDVALRYYRSFFFSALSFEEMTREGEHEEQHLKGLFSSWLILYLSDHGLRLSEKVTLEHYRQLRECLLDLHSIPEEREQQEINAKVHQTLKLKSKHGKRKTN